MKKLSKFLTKKNIIISLIFILVIVIILGVDYVFYSPSKINKFITANLYKTPANSAFTDQNFYNCVVDAYNKKNNDSVAYSTNLSDSQLQTVTNLRCSNMNIESVVGIEKLISLTELHVYYNQLTNLDVSKNTELKYLYVNNNQLTNLDVSKNISLTELVLGDNQLINLDVSKNINLKSLDLGYLCKKNSSTSSSCKEGNLISELDLTNNVNLTGLYISNNPLTSLDLSKNLKLSRLVIERTSIAVLDLSNNLQLEAVHAMGNKLTTVDFGKNDSLQGVELDDNELTFLDLTHIPNLERLRVTNNNLANIVLGEKKVLHNIQIANNELTGIDVSQCPNLTNLDLGGWYYQIGGNGTNGSNKLTSLDVSKNHALEFLNVSNNQLTNLDVSGAIALKSLSVDNNQLTNLAVSKNTSLTSLSVDNNQLTNLDVSKNTSLTDLSAHHNQLTNLDVSKNTALVWLFVDSNQLTELDVSNNIALTSLNADINQLANLDVSGAIALESLSVDINQLTNLDVSGAIALKSLSVDSNQLTNLDVSKNTSLTSLSVYENKLSSLDVSGAIALKFLSANTNQLINLDLSKNTSLTSLTVYNNKLTNLDVSKNTSLASLSVSNNELTNLDVSKNTSLASLSVSNNELTNLDVSKNTELKYLAANDNQLTNLNVSNNISLTELYTYNNQLTNLNVSNNISLTGLYTYNNQLTNLDVSKNTELKYLLASDNQLTSLDVSKNIALIRLHVNNNRLTSLDLSNNMKLMVDWTKIYNNFYSLSLFMLVGERLEIDNVVKLPSHFIPNMTYEISDGLALEGNNLVATKTGTQTYKLINSRKNPDYTETYTVEIVDVTSEVYNIDKNRDYVMVGGDSDATILSNVIVENGTASIENDYLVIKHDEYETKKFRLIRFSSSVYKIDEENKFIYVGDDTDNEIFNNVEFIGVDSKIYIDTNDNTFVVEVGENNLFTYTLVKISTDYNISNGYIYARNQEDVLDNVNIINGSKKIVDDNLVVSYGKVELEKIPILNISSDKYTITDEYIYTKFDDLDYLDYTNFKEINNKKKLSLSYTDEDELIINDRWTGEELDRLPILYANIASYDIRVSTRNDNIIYMTEETMDYQLFYDSFWMSSDLLRLELYNENNDLIYDGETVNGTLFSGNVEDGYGLKVLYNDTVIDEYIIKYLVDYLDYTDDSNVYFTDDATVDILTKLNVNKTFVDVKTLIETNGEISILDNGELELEENTIIKTGDKFNIKFNDYTHQVFLSVKGDVTGTGDIGEADVIKAYQIFKNEVDVEDYYRLAVDVKEDGKIRLNDVIKLYQYTQGIVESIGD